VADEHAATVIYLTIAALFFCSGGCFGWCLRVWLETRRKDREFEHNWTAAFDKTLERRVPTSMRHRSRRNPVPREEK
jgi:hypothetical protein